MMLGLQWDSACPLRVLGEADLVWKLEGLGWAGGMQAVPILANPEVQLRLASATESVGALITRKVRYWPSPGPTSRWACVSQSSEGVRGSPGSWGKSQDSL